MSAENGQKKGKNNVETRKNDSMNELESQTNEDINVSRENKQKNSKCSGNLCATCNKACEGGLPSAVDCGECNQRYHVTCQRLTTDQAKTLENNLFKSYICINCARPNDDFDYDSSLLRLESAAVKKELEALHSATKLESILLRDDQLTGGSEKEVCFGGEEDVISKEIISRHGTGEASGRKPVSVSANGNCLFNALSVAIVGKESLAKELRVRAFIELSDGKKFYEAEYKSSDLKHVADCYKKEFMDSAKVGTFSSTWNIQAAATVLQRNIITICPTKKTVKALNRTFHPRGSARSRPTVYIMWTSASPAGNGNWNLNHFVPLLIDSAQQTSDTESESAKVVVAEDTKEKQEKSSNKESVVKKKADGDPKQLSAEDAAKNLIKLKKNMIKIRDDHKRRKGHIMKLQPHEDGYKMLKYRERMTKDVKEEFRKYQHRKDGTSTPKVEKRDNGAPKGTIAGTKIHSELNTHIKSKGANSTPQVKDIMEGVKLFFREYENSKKDTPKEQGEIEFLEGEIEFLEGEFPFVGYMIHEIKNERPEIYFWDGNADAIGWYKGNYVIVDWKVVDLLEFWNKNSDAYGKYLHQCLVYAWLLKLHLGLEKLPYILIVPIHSVTVKDIEPGLFFDFPKECEDKLEKQYKWSTNLDGSEQEVIMSLPSTLINNIAVKNFVDKKITLGSLFKPDCTLKQLLDALGRANLKVE